MITIEKLTPHAWEAFTELRVRITQQTDYLIQTEDEMRKQSSLEVLEKHEEARSKAFYIAKDAEGRMLGYASALRYPPKNIHHSAEMEVGILEGHHGKGIGTKLVTAVSDWARGEGVVRLELFVDEDNFEAIHLYEKCGFTKEGFHHYTSRKTEGYGHSYTMAKIYEENAVTTSEK